MRYTWTLFKFQLQDTGETVLYWELELERKVVRFKTFEALKQYVDNIKILE